jgi:molybdate transport system ATP-binding protein
MITVAVRHDFPTARLNIAFAAPTPGTTMLFGPSGSGKTTTLLAIAGLFRPDRVHVSLEETVLADTGHEVFVPPEQRRMGVVFQDARLFPHLDVANNLRYGLKRAPKSVERQIAFDDVVSLLGLERTLRQRPHTLSGGEKQRVALGRALLSQPRLLLLDEPLASLDEQRRGEIMPYLLRLKHAHLLPMVYVTHAMAEVAILGDHLVMLGDGQVQASGSLADVSANPLVPMALRDDAGAVLRMRIIDHDLYRRLTRLQAGTLVLDVPLQEGRSGMVRVRVPARELILAKSQPAAISINNTLAGRVKSVHEDEQRNIALVQVTVGNSALLARVTRNAVTRLGLEAGAAVVALVKSSSIDVMPGEG